MEKIVLAMGLVALLGGSLYLMNEETQVVQPRLGGVEPQVYDLYGEWKVKYNKKFSSPDQEWYRLTVFNANYQMIKAFYEGPKQTYEMDFNQFMDITNEEFVQTYLGLQVKERKEVEVATLIVDDVPANDIDWRTKGVLNAVKNQGSCGSCWAFSAVGSLESGVAIHTKTLNNYSEQDLVDCSGTYGNAGCNGGWMDSAFDYIIAHGVAMTSAYAYTGRDGTCKNVARTKPISGYTDVNQGDCAGLEKNLQNQPIAVAVDASNWSFYAGGVFSSCGTSLNHGVTLVAASSTEWTIRNSWASGWGEQGHIRLAKGNTCGVCNAASFPKVA